MLWVNNLYAVTYRYEGSFKDAEIQLLYNGNPMEGSLSSNWRL